MIEERGQLVSKEELLQVRWAKTQVSDGVREAIILEIRRVLGDDPTVPRLLRPCRARAARRPSL